ncbi:MAG: cobamide remodeling phosphodiesterase CbiR [Promethearchaeota archaeon]
MVLLFGVRPFEFQDFIGMIEQGKLDISSVNYTDIVKASLQDGFQHFEITGDLAYVLPGLLRKDVIDQLNEVRIINNYSCSVHLPIWAIELASPNVHVKKASIDCLVESIELTRHLKPICWIIHATGALVSEFSLLNLPSYVKSFISAQFALAAQKSIAEIIDRTNIPSRKLAVENVEFPFRVMEECIEELDLSICFDTGHLLAGYSGEWNGVLDFFEMYAERIIELHLHDGAAPRIDHQPLGTYDLPVKDLFERLLEVQFSGPIVFELDLIDVRNAMTYIKENIPEALS